MGKEVGTAGGGGNALMPSDEEVWTLGAGAPDGGGENK